MELPLFGAPAQKGFFALSLARGGTSFTTRKTFEGGRKRRGRRLKPPPRRNIRPSSGSIPAKSEEKADISWVREEKISRRSTKGSITAMGREEKGGKFFVDLPHLKGGGRVVGGVKGITASSE